MTWELYLQGLVVALVIFPMIYVFLRLQNDITELALTLFIVAWPLTIAVVVTSALIDVWMAVLMGFTNLCGALRRVWRYFTDVVSEDSFHHEDMSQRITVRRKWSGKVLSVTKRIKG